MVQKSSGDQSKQEPYKVQSVDRALQILTCFNLVKPELTLIEICELTKLPKPTVFRLLASLEARQFIQRTADGQHYSIGIRLFELGNVYLSNLSIERLATPHMRKITRDHKIACNLAILNDGQVVYIASTSGGGPFQYAPIVGYRHYIHCSALGKSLVLDLPDDEIKFMLQQWGMPALSPKTITDSTDYLAELERYRSKEFTVDDQEGAVGIYCLAVPIRTRTGKVIAAMSVSGPSPMYSEEFKNALISDLQNCASDISKQL